MAYFKSFSFCKKKVWDAITGTALSVFFRHPRRLTTCAWHPSNSDFVLTGSEDGTMFCWKVSSYPFSDSKESHFEKKRRKVLGQPICVSVRSILFSSRFFDLIFG